MKIPLWAHKTHEASDGILTVLSNDKYDTVRSPFKFALNL